MRGLRDNLSIGAPLMIDLPSQWASNRPTCRGVTDRASEYLDDRLVGPTKVLVDMHLVSCAHCRVYMKQIDLISAALKGLTTLHPSSSNVVVRANSLLRAMTRRGEPNSPLMPASLVTKASDALGSRARE